MRSVLKPTNEDGDGSPGTASQPRPESGNTIQESVYPGSVTVPFSSVPTVAPRFILTRF